MRPLLLASLAALALSLALGHPDRAHAQDAQRPPDTCGMTEATAQYGPFSVGSTVVLQRHRFVRGDDNWDDQMTRWLGRAARITRLAGVDAQGCPGVRVDADGGQWFWRIRDLNVGTGPQPPPPPRAASAEGIPQECGQVDGRLRYGPVRVGAVVVLGRHRMVNGDDNWADEMMQYVGRRARVVEQSGTDSAGCPGVRVDIDSQAWFWRIRDLRMPGAGDVDPMGEGSTTASLGVSTDHGRPATTFGGLGALAGGSMFGAGVGVAIPTPQDCGLSDTSVRWGPIQIGAVVTLGRHRAVNGDDNWASEMDPFVGRVARVTELIGVDDQGCPVVHVDADGGAYFWRVRDLTIGGATVPLSRTWIDRRGFALTLARR